MCRFHLAGCTLPTEPAGIPPEAASAHFQDHFSSSMLFGESPLQQSFLILEVGNYPYSVLRVSGVVIPKT
jgi:hypothetical protein